MRESGGPAPVATVAVRIVGHLQLVAGAAPGELAIKNMAVADDARGRGVGRALVEAAVADARIAGASLVTVATATADTGNLRFHQRVGFRFQSVERDAFTAASGYPDPIVFAGIELRDRIWLSREL